MYRESGHSFIVAVKSDALKKQKKKKERQCKKLPVNMKSKIRVSVHDHSCKETIYGPSNQHLFATESMLKLKRKSTGTTSSVTVNVSTYTLDKKIHVKTVHIAYFSIENGIGG